MRKRKDGRYTKRIRLSNGATKDVYGYSPEEVENKILDIRIQEKSGLVLNDNTLFGEWAIIWYKTNKENRGSFSTQYSYKNIINVHLMPTLGGMRLRDIKQVHIKQILKDRDTYSSSLQHKILITLNQIFNDALNNGLISNNPAKGIINSGKKTKEKRPLTAEEKELLLESVKNTNVELFINIALFCGLRRGEILGLKWSDIDFENRILHVSRAVEFKENAPIIKEPKTKAGTRNIPIPLNLYNLLLEYPKDKEYLFTKKDGTLMSKMAFRRMWDIVIDKLQKSHNRDIPISESQKKCNMIFEVTPHILRHTYCTFLYSAGVDLKTAQYFMGHANISITAQIYTHMEEQHIESAKNKIDSFISQNSVKNALK